MRANCLFVVVTIILVAVCASAQTDESEPLKVCTSGQSPPFFYQEDGGFAGFEHDILSSLVVATA